MTSIAVVLDTESNRTIDPEIERLIESEWQRQLEAAVQRDVIYYDSESYRLNDFEIVDGEMVLHLAPGAYRVHAAMKAIHTNPRIGERHVDRQLIVDAIVHTGDGHVVLHTVEKVVETETYLVGGSCSKSRTVIESGADLVAYMLERVDSVLGLAADERVIGDLRGIVQNEIGCSHAIFDVFTSLKADEVQTRFQPGPTSKSVVIVRSSEILDWICGASGYMNVIEDLMTFQLAGNDIPTY